MTNSVSTGARQSGAHARDTAALRSSPVLHGYVGRVGELSVSLRRFV